MWEAYGGGPNGELLQCIKTKGTSISQTGSHGRGRLFLTILVCPLGADTHRSGVQKVMRCSGKGNHQHPSQVMTHILAANYNTMCVENVCSPSMFI